MSAGTIQTMKEYSVNVSDIRLRTDLRASGGADSTTNARHLGTTSLIKNAVYDAAGKFLGEIEEIVIDVRTGCVRYAVLAFGGILGFGRKRFAVPWSALTPDADRQRCIVDITLMRLMAVPVHRNDTWLQGTNLTRSKENSYLLRTKGFLGVSRQGGGLDVHPNS